MVADVSQEPSQRGGRGRVLARAALSIGYAIGSLSVLVTLLDLVRMTLA